MMRADSRQSLTTSPTLLGRLRNPKDAQAWNEFNSRYRDLIVRFLRSRGLQMADAEDTTQLVLTKLVGGLQAFEYDKSKGGFRSYLFCCVRSAISDHLERQARRIQPVSQSAMVIQSPSDHDLFAEFEREWVDHHYRVATQRYRDSADERSIAVLEAIMLGKSVRQIGDELEMTESAVHKAQQRLRDRLRLLIAEQLRDEEDGHERTG